MNNLKAVASTIESEIEMGNQCLANILARLDEDIARINERKQQLTDEFAARRRALEALLGAPVSTKVEAEVNPDA